MRKSITLTVLVMMGTVMPTASVRAEVDCSLLDPRASVSTEKEGKITASVNTLFKIAKAGGSVDGKIRNEIQNLQKGSPVTEKSLIELRTLYLFCGMVANAKDITTDRKVALFNLMMKTKEETPKHIKQKKRSTVSITNKDVVVPHNDEQKVIQQQNISQPNQQTNVSVTSQGQTGGITAQTVTINNFANLKDAHESKTKAIDELRLSLESRALTLEEKKLISEFYDKRSRLSDEWRSLYDKYAELNRARGSTDAYNFELQTIAIKMSEITKQIGSIDDSLSELEKKERSNYQLRQPLLPPGKLRVE
jgi:hypothetical protein